MDWVNDYLHRAVYVDGGRGPVEYDCWGLVREARDKHLGLSVLPSYSDLRNTDPRSFTKAYLNECDSLRECQPEHGAIAAVLVGKICVHVALVLKEETGLVVLEINPKKSARVLPLVAWLSEHSTVSFHND